MSQAVQSSFQTALNRHGADANAAAGLSEALPFQNDVGNGLTLRLVQIGEGCHYCSAAFKLFGLRSHGFHRQQLVQITGDQ